MRHFSLTILAVLVGVIFAVPAFALTVSPAKLELTGDPGQTIHGEIDLYNEQDGSRSFYSSFENFEPSGDSGAPHFIGADGDLATWIQTDTKVTLENDQHIVVPFTVTIPQNAEPGGHFAAIFFGDQPINTADGGQVVVGGKIGVLMLLRVSGDVAEGGGIQDFSTKDQQKLFTMLPVTFNFKVNNTGGDRIVPKGDIVIKNTFQMIAESVPANKTEGSVLPGSARKFEATWGEVPAEVATDSAEQTSAPSPSFFDMVKQEWGNFHLGWYTADLQLTWGSDNAPQLSSYTFFVIPWQLLTVIGSGLLLLGLLGILVLKRYNRWIIAAAARQQAMPLPPPPPAPTVPSGQKVTKPKPKAKSKKKKKEDKK